MTFSVFSIAMFLVSVSFIEYAQCTDPPLTEFGKKVEKLVPKENFNKIFADNYISNKEVTKGVEEGVRNILKIIGIPFDAAIVQEADKLLFGENERLENSRISFRLIFHFFTYAIQTVLDVLRILNHDNIDDFAQSFADEINKSAEDLKEEDIASTFKAINTAVVNFLKSQGLTRTVGLIVENYLVELGKYQGISLVQESAFGKVLKQIFPPTF